jgi:hypothetical protein
MKPRHLIPAILLALLIAYPLSAGPVSGYYFNHKRQQPAWLDTFYEPLMWATSQSEWLVVPYNWYIVLWERHDDVPRSN